MHQAEFKDKISKEIKFMRVVLCCFASRRYWNNENELNNVFLSIKSQLKDICNDIYLIEDDNTFDCVDIKKEDLLIAIPMSGGVQPNVIGVSDKFSTVLLYAGYVKGNFDNEICNKMLINNAAPAIMDVYAVLKRTAKTVKLCISNDEIYKYTKVIGVVQELKHCKLLAIGKTEPWVISSVKEWSVVKDKFGIEIIDVSQDELVDMYNSIEKAEAEEKSWLQDVEKVIEPTKEDISNASIMQKALSCLMEKYQAQGAAIACFNLLKTGTTSCLGVSYINTQTNYVVSCEGDMDSAITMLIMKKLANDTVWMANPNIQSDGTVNFVHCTAPIKVNGEQLRYSLRSHHESGIGVSVQVELPKGVDMTACRISNSLSQMTVHSCVGEIGDYEHSCRTQLKIRFDDFNSYLKNALGCHQIFVFKDIKEELQCFAEITDIEVL